MSTLDSKLQSFVLLHKERLEKEKELIQSIDIFLNIIGDIGKSKANTQELKLDLNLEELEKFVKQVNSYFSFLDYNYEYMPGLAMLNVDLPDDRRDLRGKNLLTIMEILQINIIDITEEESSVFNFFNWLLLVVIRLLQLGCNDIAIILSITNITKLFELLPKEIFDRLEQLAESIQERQEIFQNQNQNIVNTKSNLDTIINQIQDEKFQDEVLKYLRKHIDDEHERTNLIQENFDKIHVISQELESNFKLTNQDQVFLGSSNKISALFKAILKIRSLLSLLLKIILCCKDLGERKLENYNNLFQVVPLPQTHSNFQDDATFAYMQVAGSNPVMIKRVQSIEKDLKRFPIRDQHYRDAIENDSLESACKEGRLYLADYSLLDEAESGNFPTSQKYLYARLALFALPPIGDSSRSLVPVAIQCQQKCGEQNPIFTKKNEENWMTAKTIVQMADSNYHELISHLGRTHLFIEPFAIATYRRLSINHPVGILLREHFKGTFIINYAAHKFLVAPKGQVDELLAGTITADRRLTVKGAQSYLLDFNNSIFPKTLESRGVKEKGLLNYPYRDDALQIWDAIHAWVDNYLKISYQVKNIQSDREVQNWVSELLFINGGRLSNFGEDSKIQTLEYLTDVISMIIFTASAQHAAVNFPQKDLMAYVPAFPLAAYSPAPTDTEKEKYFTELLPPLIQAKDQLDILYLLGSVYHTKLGNYYGSHFTNNEQNPKIYEALQDFKNKLGEIESNINKRNTYKFLLPSKIPQSINI